MMCFHRYDKVNDDGYQYCKKCGKAILPKCNHKWVLIKDIEVKKDWSHAAAFGNEDKTLFIRVYECSKCKAIKNEKTGL